MPQEDWIGFFKHHFGPSILWALLGIGASHIVLAPTMGAMFGVFAVWALAFIFIVKYGAWSLGIRYNYTVGKDLLEGYKDLPGPGNWALWLSAAAILIAGVLNTAALGMAGAAFAAAITPVTQLQAFVVMVVAAVLLVVGTNYDMLERFLLSFVALFVLLMILGITMGPPPASVIAETTFAVPALLEPPFLPVFAGAAGLVPTLIISSLMLSSWSLTKNQGAQHESVQDAAAPEHEAYISAWLETGLKDFRIGYLFSFLLMAIMALLAANVLYPTMPEGGIAQALGGIFEETYGRWAFYVVLVAAFAALWSTVITALDGSGRVLWRISNELGYEYPAERTRQIIVAVLGVASAIPVLIFGQTPVVLVVALGTFGIIVEVFVYPSNLYLVYNEVPEKFRPSRSWLAYYGVAIVIFVGLAILGGLSQAGVL